MPVKFEGWKTKKISDIFHFKCPYCSGCFESYGNNKCPKCNKNIQRNELNEIFIKKNRFTCNVCEFETNLNPGILDYGGFGHTCIMCGN
ncbi:hypothetical protein GQ473_06995, partial [archaeon]|nr:hypothetical protein [archaeon]